MSHVWITGKNPHFNRGGRFLSFEELVNAEHSEVMERASMETLLAEVRGAIHEVMLSLERGDMLSVTIEVYKGGR